MTDTTPTPPEGPHAELVLPDVDSLRLALTWLARVEGVRPDYYAEDAAEWLTRLAALSDSVPRELVESMDNLRTLAELERDAALAVIEQVRQAREEDEIAGPNLTITRVHSYYAPSVDAILDQAPADALDRVKAEAGAQALDGIDREQLILAVRDIVNHGKGPELHLAGYEAARIADAAIEQLRTARAAALREGAGS